jgi:hypothetical protein
MLRCLGCIPGAEVALHDAHQETLRNQQCQFAVVDDHLDAALRQQWRPAPGEVEV